MLMIRYVSIAGVEKVDRCGGIKMFKGNNLKSGINRVTIGRLIFVAYLKPNICFNNNHEINVINIWV